MRSLFRLLALASCLLALSPGVVTVAQPTIPTASTGAITKNNTTGNLTGGFNTGNQTITVNTGGSIAVSGTGTVTATTVNGSGTITATGVSHTLGGGGTGSTNAILTIDGSNASSYGPYLRLQRNSANLWQIGAYSGIQGGTSSDFLIYNSSASGEALRISSSGFVATVGPGGSSSNNAILTISGSSASSYGAQLRFNRGGAQKWDVGHHSGIQGGTSDDFLVYNLTAGNESLRIAAATGNLKFGAYGAGTLTTDSSGNVSATSDERAKDNLQAYTKGLSQVRQLTPKSYTWRPETGLNTADVVVSLTAQDLLAAGLTEAVNTERTVPVMDSVQIDGRTVQRQRIDAQGRPVVERVPAAYYTVSDRAVIAALVNAIKELAARVEALENP